MATTPIKAPKVEKISDILTSIQPAIDPLLANQREQMGLVDQRVAADTAGLEQAKINAFRGITNKAQAMGNTFSGIPIGEEARYVGEKFLPAMANLKINAQNENIRIRDIMAQIQRDAYMQAFSTNQHQKDNLFTYNRDEAGRYYGTSERVAGQKYHTSERIAGQKYNTSERIAGQKFTTGERIAAQNWQATQNVLSRRARGGGGGGSSSGAESSARNQYFNNALAQLGAQTTDGNIHPDDFNALKAEYVASGGKARDFNYTFYRYVNPGHEADYGIHGGTGPGNGGDFGGGLRPVPKKPMSNFHFGTKNGAKKSHSNSGSKSLSFPKSWSSNKKSSSKNWNPRGQTLAQLMGY